MAIISFDLLLLLLGAIGMVGLGWRQYGRRQAGQSRRTDEPHFRQLAEQSDLVFWFTALVPERVLYVSPAFDRLWGIPADRLYQDPRIWLAAIHVEDRPLVETAFACWIDGRAEHYDVCYRIVRPNGEVRWIHDRGAAVTRNAAGQPIQISGIADDITAQQHAEQALRASEERLSLAIDAAGMGTWDADARTGEAIWSATMFRMLGYEPEPTGKATTEMWRRCVHPDDLSKVLRALDGAHCERALYAPEHRIIRVDNGLIVWLRAFGRFQYAESGEAVRFTGVCFDNTEHHLAEEKLRQSERLYRAIGESIDYGVWVCDPQGRNIYASESFLRLVGITQEQCSDFGWGDLLHPDDVDRTLAAWKACVRTLGVWDIEHRFRGVDGKYHPILARGVPVKDESGKVVCWAGINLDISRLKQAEASLRETDRRKDEFLAMLAHELRNPLAPIRNAVQILQVLGPAEPKLQWARDVIERQVRHLARLVDDLLDVSRLLRGKIVLRKAPVDLAAVIEHAVEISRPLIESRRQQLDVILPPRPVYLEGDLTRLAQALANLLNNAAKYTDEEGHIELVVEEAQGEMAIRVRDNGMGIPATLLPHIFDLFTQAERTPDRTQGGLGIGLTVVKNLVELHGGTIEAKSEGPGRGSEFIIRLPVRAAPESGGKAYKAEPARRSGSAEPRILVVDDNIDAAESVAMLLELEGYEVRTVHTGAAALALAPDFQPRVILLDLGLPGMDGYEVARRLRANPATQAVKLIALTGYGQAEDRQRSQAAGFDGHLVKPVDPKVLLRVITMIGPEKVGTSSAAS
ncbi:MAG: PAS domain-containing protein [Candidatus Competibacteraceae bacterium]